jgi:hypothetical protein
MYLLIVLQYYYNNEPSFIIEVVIGIGDNLHGSVAFFISVTILLVGLKSDQVRDGLLFH